MDRGPRSYVVVALVAAMVVTPAVAVALPDGERPAVSSTNATAPGEQLAGVVGVQGAEVDGAVDNRAYESALAAAGSNTSRARVVADRVATLQDRLDTLQQRREDLQTAFRNGSIDRGQYRARIATVAADLSTVRQQLNRSDAVAAELPDQARRAGGLNTTALATLRTRASNLSGGEVSQIARQIAGPGVGRGVGGPPAEVPRRGPPSDRPGNGTAGPSNGGPPNDRSGNGTGGPPDTGSPGDGRSAGAPNGTPTTGPNRN